MVIKNKNIAQIQIENIKGNKTLELLNCIIDTIDFMGVYEINIHIKIENCIINHFNIHSCWFVEGLLIKNSIIKNFIDYQMGGHNLKPIVLEGNIFLEFFNFFDCQFIERVEVVNNVFFKGTNLLGNKGEGYENSFRKTPHIKNNLGNFDINAV